MTRRLWFVAGAGVGVYATARARRAVEAFSPDGLRDRAGAAVVGLRLLGAEVAAGRAEREAELRGQLGRHLGRPAGSRAPGRHAPSGPAAAQLAAPEQHHDQREQQS